MNTPSAREPAPSVPAPRADVDEFFARRRNTDSVLEQISLESHVSMNAHRVTINAPIVTTQPAERQCYVCKMVGHTATNCCFAYICPRKLKPTHCGAQEHARRAMWLSGGERGLYPFGTSHLDGAQDCNSSRCPALVQRWLDSFQVVKTAKGVV